MRQGVNPEKYKEEKNVQKQHRVIVVFYIPNLTDDYYSETLTVLDTCLHSLVTTINPEATNITLVNNNSTPESEVIVAKYRSQIDKYIVYAENKGKVYAAVNEARSVFEPFVTIADSDILFFPGWERAVFEVFDSHPKAGVVTPLPSQYSAFYCNASLFFDAVISRKLRYDKIVSDEDVELYLKGVNNEALIKRNAKYNWKEKQYYLDGKIKAVVGATHFVATYKSWVFKNQHTFPEIKFKNGYEEKFMDCLSDERGLYRLSTVKSYAYHIGNKTDGFTVPSSNEGNKKLNPSIFKNIKKLAKQFSLVPYVVKKAFLKAYKKNQKI